MPTQMGRTADPPLSRSMTIGMLVTGSIISPRIFISTSIGLSFAPSGRHLPGLRGNGAPWDTAGARAGRPLAVNAPQTDSALTPTRLFGPADVTRTFAYWPVHPASPAKLITRLLLVRPTDWPS